MLTTTLNTAVGSLLANAGALQTTNNNIANANTPGYTREVVDLQSIGTTGGNVGGVSVSGFQSVRDELLQMQINQQIQQQGSANAQTSSLQSVQTTFTTSSGDIGTQMSALFSAITNLETDPSNSSLRQAVMTAGQNLATAFNNTSNALTSQQQSLNTQVTQDVGQINQLTKQIAALNPQISTMNANGQDAGPLQDQQDQLVQQLSALTGVQETKTNNGITLTTGNGTPLVVSGQSYALNTAPGSDGLVHVVDVTGTDITGNITGGDLGGTLKTRNQQIPSLLNQLDTLANQFAGAFNSVQASGFTQSGTAGSNFFTVSSSVTGSAASIKLALTSPADVAASSDGASGSGGNLVNFAAVQSTKLASGQTPTDSYANLVFQVGSMLSTANTESSATTSSLLQLNNQLSSVSGVSIDEESANLIKYQQAYEAAARVISTVNSLMSVTMSMGTQAAA
ncbi:MAG TPA: flagellar hook-associated protein FlgK [Acidobacteriaceae bacterium]|jgi:flagellar hook-associated protein 1 FlgK